ncbi:MAG: hypothetical protein MJ189_06040, partial [Coriobacteriales bacterium]|nr:hypothetical protein [Coriobacteriales bacterium]
NTKETNPSDDISINKNDMLAFDNDISQMTINQDVKDYNFITPQKSNENSVKESNNDILQTNNDVKSS